MSTARSSRIVSGGRLYCPITSSFSTFFTLTAPMISRTRGLLKVCASSKVKSKIRGRRKSVGSWLCQHGILPQECIHSCSAISITTRQAWSILWTRQRRICTSTVASSIPSALLSCLLEKLYNRKALLSTMVSRKPTIYASILNQANHSLKLYSLYI